MQVVAKARIAFATHRSKSVAFRVSQLKGLERMLNENEDVLCDALTKDLRKPSFESIITEFEFTRNELRALLQNIDIWTKPQRKEKTIATVFDSVYVHYEPYGVVLVIGAWNYPLQLALMPLAAAIAAGNACILKPSEIAGHFAQAIANLLPQYLDRDLYPVVLGGSQETTALLREQFDYIFYTGSAKVGRLVHQAAAQHLTPTTLELGGKSPVYIDDSVTKLYVAAKRIVWGKFLNSGQTCVAPDYIMCTKEVQSQLVELMTKIIREYYGDDVKASPDYARIVSDAQWKRLSKLLATTKGTVVMGGSSHEGTRYIAPTVVTDVLPDDALMEDEIFGPILPIMLVADLDDAIDYVNRHGKPLALYVFSNQSSVIKRFKNETSSGGMVVHDTVLHLATDSLPFGGVGSSGMGAYHGRYSFETFSHAKPVLHRNYMPVSEYLGG